MILLNLPFAALVFSTFFFFFPLILWRSKVDSDVCIVEKVNYIWTIIIVLKWNDSGRFGSLRTNATVNFFSFFCFFFFPPFSLLHDSHEEFKSILEALKSVFQLFNWTYILFSMEITLPKNHFVWLKNRFETTRKAGYVVTFIV